MIFPLKKTNNTFKKMNKNLNGPWFNTQYCNLSTWNNVWKPFHFCNVEFVKDFSYYHFILKKVRQKIVLKGRP